MAPSAIDSERSGMIRSGSISSLMPSPWHSGQAPCGVLNENVRGSISASVVPCSGQANSSENGRSVPPFEPSAFVWETIIVRFPQRSAVSTESVSRVRCASASSPCSWRTTRRSITASMVWFL